MATQIYVVVGLNSESEESIARRYGIVIGGGAGQDVNFAKLKAQLMTDVGSALSPAANGLVAFSEDAFTSKAVTYSGMRSIDLTSILASTADAVVAIINVDLTATDLQTRLGKGNAADVTLPSATMAQRLLPLISSLGVGLVCNITVTGNAGASDTVQAQAGDAI